MCRHDGDEIGFVITFETAAASATTAASPASTTAQKSDESIVEFENYLDITKGLITEYLNSVFNKEKNEKYLINLSEKTIKFNIADLMAEDFQEKIKSGKTLSFPIKPKITGQTGFIEIKAKNLTTEINIENLFNEDNKDSEMENLKTFVEIMKKLDKLDHITMVKFIDDKMKAILYQQKPIVKKYGEEEAKKNLEWQSLNNEYLKYLDQKKKIKDTLVYKIEKRLRNKSIETQGSYEEIFKKILSI